MRGSLRSVMIDVGKNTLEKKKNKPEAENLIWIKFFHMIPKNEKWFEGQRKQFPQLFSLYTKDTWSSVFSRCNSSI